MKSLGPGLHATRIAHDSAARSARPGRLNVLINLPSGARLGLPTGSVALYIAASAPLPNAGPRIANRRIDRLCGTGRYAMLVLDLRLVDTHGTAGSRRLSAIRSAMHQRRMAVQIRCRRQTALLLALSGWPPSSLSIE